MKFLLALLFGSTLFSAHKKASSQIDNPDIKSVKIVQKGWWLFSTKVKIRRTTHVYVSGISGRNVVSGFCDDGSVLVQLEDGNIKAFFRNRLSLCEPLPVKNK